MVASAAALAVEFITIHAYRYKSRAERPEWLTSAFYWVSTFVFAVIGGALAAGYTWDQQLKFYVVINIGVAWPLILQRVAALVPQMTIDAS